MPSILEAAAQLCIVSVTGLRLLRLQDTMGVSFLMLLASTLVPLAHEGWDHEMQTITDQARHPALSRSEDLDRAAQRAARMGPRPDLREVLRAEGLQDGLILPVVVISPALPDIRHAWRARRRAHPGPRCDALWPSARRVTPGGRVLNLFRRNPPKTFGVGDTIRLQGEVTSDIADIRALVRRPDELVSEAKIGRRGTFIGIGLP